jgi:hypothetical protein
MQFVTVASKSLAELEKSSSLVALRRWARSQCHGGYVSCSCLGAQRMHASWRGARASACLCVCCCCCCVCVCVCVLSASVHVCDSGGGCSVGSAAAAFVVQSRFKLRSEGDAVNVGDQVVLVSAKESNIHLHISGAALSNGDREARGARRRMCVGR